MALDLGGAVSTASVVVGAVVAVLGVVGYQNRRAKLSAIRSAFNAVIGLLAAKNPERRLAGAILLRRFLDPSSELGIRDGLLRRRAPYAKEAQYVIAAVLRGIPRGNLQKLLADGLADAKTLKDADLQRTNLQDAYLAPKNRHGDSLERADFLEHADFYRADLSEASLRGVHAQRAAFYQARLQGTVLRDADLQNATFFEADLSGADLRDATFFEADLSGASLRGVKAQRAAFYQARLQGTVLRDADLRGVDFFEADLLGADFGGALLGGASFAGARNIPVELMPHLDNQNRYRSTDPAPAPAAPAAKRRHVFLSAPSARTPAQDSICDRLAELLGREGLVLEAIPRHDYPPSAALAEIARRLAGCAGMVVLGFRRGGTDPEAPSAGITPWTHVEAGMAYGNGLPLLLLRQRGVNTGVFDHAVDGYHTHVVELELEDRWNEEALRTALAPWISEVRPNR